MFLRSIFTKPWFSEVHELLYSFLPKKRDALHKIGPFSRTSLVGVSPIASIARGESSVNWKLTTCTYEQGILEVSYISLYRLERAFL